MGWKIVILVCEMPLRKKVSLVYIRLDKVHPSKLYTLTHIVCNDSESLDLVVKETQVMLILKGHLNVVTLIAHDVFLYGWHRGGTSRGVL